jgi:hypothetical protein
MTSVSKVDQAIILLKDRLRLLDARNLGATAASVARHQSATSDPLRSLRELIRTGQVDEQVLRRAFVRTLLADSLGDELVASIEFQSVSDEVSRLIEQSKEGSALVTRALAELG